MWESRSLGHGIGLRNTHYGYLLEHGPHDVDWFEIISENFLQMSGRPWAVLQRVRQDVPVVMHGVSMAIGNAGPLNYDHLKQLKKLKEAIEPAWISDHICWGGFGGHYAHDLLPLPYTEETLAHLVPKILEVQDFLGCRMVFENVSSYVTFQESEMTEWEFVKELATRADCGLLVDVNNIYVSGFNHDFDPQVYLDAIPPERVAQFHVAGHSNYGTHIIDTHIGPIIPEVWDVYRMAIKQFGHVPTLIEWDSEVPSFDEVVAESLLARRIEEEVLSASNPTGQVAEDILEVHHSDRDGEEHHSIHEGGGA